MIWTTGKMLCCRINQFNFLIGQSHDVWRSYSLFVARVTSFATVQVMLLRGTQINCMPNKSHVIIIIINTLGQIVQICFIRKDCLI